MPYKASKSSAFLFSILLSTSCLFFAGVSHASSEMKGCDPKVMDAMHAKAEAQVAYDVAAAEEFISKPDSVLKLTCFNKQAGQSAEVAGDIFSGKLDDETSGTADEKEAARKFKKVIGNALKDAFAEPTAGFADTLPDTTDTTIAAGANCDHMQTAWQASEEEGIKKTAPYASFDDLANGSIPAGAGADFTASFNASKNDQNTFSTLKNATDALKAAKPPPVDFSTVKSSCDAMVAAGISAGPCGGGP